MDGKRKRKAIIFTLLLSGALTACGGREAEEKKEEAPEISQMDADTADDAGDVEEALESEPEETEAKQEEPSDVAQQFGETCIADQTFQVSLSEYEGKVWFVPRSPAEDGQDFSMEIVQNGEVLTRIVPYVPEELAGEPFTSLDAVSFYDVNYDGNTDIVLIETCGNTSFAAVYYGFSGDDELYGRAFVPQERLSEGLTGQAEPLTVAGLREILADGKKNGEFGSFQEAYAAVGRLSELESEDALAYDLIDFDGDDVPELVTGAAGYYVSLYTYENGTVYQLMDHWSYGAMGNAGYEYAPGKNSMRNYNSDYAGAILYTTYMTMNDRHELDTVVQIETYNFDDVNKNGFPDEEEEASLGAYSISYIDGQEASVQECASYDMGGYEYMEPKMSLEELWEQ